MCSAVNLEWRLRLGFSRELNCGLGDIKVIQRGLGDSHNYLRPKGENPVAYCPLVSFMSIAFVAYLVCV